MQLDVTKPEQIAAAAELVAEHGAGVGVPGPLETMPLEKLRFSFDVDVFGQVAVTQAMLPLLRSACGRIVFIGSIADRCVGRCEVRYRLDQRHLLAGVAVGY